MESPFPRFSPPYEVFVVLNVWYYYCCKFMQPTALGRLIARSCLRSSNNWASGCQPRWRGRCFRN